MAAITANFSLSFDITNDKFVITDTTDYVGQGELPANWEGVLKITSPANIVIYNNTSFLSPDISPGGGSNSLITLPKDTATLKVLKGIYTITFTISDGVDFCPVTKTFNFQYGSPTISIDGSYNCVTPLIQSQDATNYLVDGQSPTSTTRLHTLYYPDTTAGPDISGDVDLIQTSVMYVLDNGEPLQYEIALTSTLVYSYAASGINSAFGVTDEISGDDYLNITCDPNLCSVYCGIKKQYDHYIETKGTLEGDKAKAKLTLMSGIAELARIAFECNKTADVTGLLNEIKSIGGFADDCSCGTGSVVLYQGLGAVAPGVVVAEGTGIDVAAVTVGAITTYTVSVEASLINIINNFEKSLPVDGNQIEVIDLGIVGDARNFQIDLNLGLSVGNIPMVKALGKELEDSPLSYNGTSLAVSLAAGKDLNLAFGAGSIVIDDTQSLLAVGSLSAGVFDDGGTITSGLVASGTSSVKATATDITSVFAGHSVVLSASGIVATSVGGTDTATLTVLNGVITHQAPSQKFEVINPVGIVTAPAYQVNVPSGNAFGIDTDGKCKLGLLAVSSDVTNVVIGNLAVDTIGGGNGTGNVIIGKSAQALTTGAISSNAIAIGNEASIFSNQSVNIGYRAGNQDIAAIAGSSAVSIGANVNYDGVGTNGIGASSVGIGNVVNNTSAGNVQISIGQNITNTRSGGIVLGYTLVGTVNAAATDSFNLVFNSTTPQVVFKTGGDSYFNLGSIMFGSNSAAPSQLSVDNGDVEVVQLGSGYIVKSADGNRWRITVANGGLNVVIAAA
jgi:hypothetical protein